MVADDHAFYRRELIEVLEREPSFQVVAEAATGIEAVQLARALRPGSLDLVLMDIEMPLLGGIAATAEITSRDPELPVVMLTVSSSDNDLMAALRAGAVGFLGKHLAPNALVRALRDYKRNRSLPMSREMAAKMLGYFRERQRAGLSTPTSEEHGLTQREREVLAMIASGGHDHEIAEALFLAETTVKTHVRNVLRKLHARNRAEAVARLGPRPSA